MSFQIDVEPPSKDDGREYDVLADGIDVTWQIRNPKVDAKVSRVSAYPDVRKALTKQQRRIGLRGDVLPEADLKIFLDASVEERAKRRYDQRINRGEEVDFPKILKMLKKRDNKDSTREIAPLRAASDAVVIYTDALSVPEVLARIEECAQLTEKD